ncbi:hypothetical protein GCM10022280_08550 [Sphingomonas swuensis]|uniref:Uncharacterized protein n=1 Tax=Sphingomonas swuensis TaxID=977800 RepID=A0ABP7SKJ9_9SPHN
MLEQGLIRHQSRLEYVGPIGAKPAELGPVLQILDTVDIWLAGTLQSFFSIIKR